MQILKGTRNPTIGGGLEHPSTIPPNFEMFFMPLVETCIDVHLCPFVEDPPLFGSALHAGTQARDELRQAVGVGSIFFRGR